jgi:hypothetical protein
MVLSDPTGGLMMDEFKGVARVKFHAGKLDEWKRLMRAQLGGDQPKLFTPWMAAHG